MKIKSFDFITKKFISVCCAIAVLATSLPLSALLMRTNAATTGDYINFEDKNAGDIVNGNDNFTIGGQDDADKFYFYAKNKTADTLTLTFDNINLEAGKKYTLDMDIYTLRTSEDADNNLLGLKIYGTEASLEANVSNTDVIEEMWSNYHIGFTAKEAANKFDFSIHTIGKVVIEDLAIVDENGARTELDFATACGNTNLKDHFSAATLYEIANEEPDIIRGYIKANIPENAVTYINEYIDIPLGTALTEGKYTLSMDLKFSSTSSDRITMCMAVFGQDASGEEYKWYLDSKDAVMNKYSNYTRDFNLTEKNTYIRIHAYQGTTVCIDNVILKDAAGQEVVKFDFDEAINFTGSNNFVQKGIAKTKAASYALFRSLSRAAQDNYAIYIDNSANDIQSDAIWFNLLGAAKMNLAPGKTYTLKFDNYALNKSTKGYCYVGVHGTGGGITGQNWWNTSDTLNGWATQSVNFTVSGDKALAYHTLHVGAGFKGYLDNFRVFDGNTEVATLTFDASNEGKTSAGATVVKLPADVDPEATPLSENYAIYIDNSANTIQSGQIWFNLLGAAQMNLAPGKTYTLKFDNYALSKSTKGHCYVGVHSTGGGITGQNWWNTSDTLNGWATQSVNFTVSGDKALAYHTLHVGAGFKGYLDNFRVFDGNTEVATLTFDASNEGKTSAGATVVKLPADIDPEATPLSENYAIYIDNSANDIQSDAIWFNILGAAQMNLAPGKTYTLKFDNYALNKSTKGHCYVGVHSTGGGITGQNWWNTSDTLNGWATQSVNFTVSGDKALAYHTLHVGAGFKGYLDNFRVFDGNTEVATLTFDASNEGKTSAGATVVKLPADIDPDNSEAGTEYSDDFAILTDNSAGTDFAQLYLHELGMPYDKTYPIGNYKIEFDFYPLAIGASKNIVALISAAGWGGNAFPGSEGQKWLEIDTTVGKWQKVSFEITTIAEGQFPWFYIGAGMKGYIDNYKITNTRTGKVLLDFSPTSNDIGKISKDVNTVVNMPKTVADAKPQPSPELTSGMNIAILKGKAGKDGASIKLGGEKSPLTLKSNATYKLSFKYYQANPTDTGVLNLFGIKPDASVIGKDNEISWFKKNNADGWTTASFVFSTGTVASTTADWLEIILNGNAWVYFDDFKIKEQEIDNNKEIQVVDFKNADDSIYPYAKVEDCVFSHSNEMGGTFKAVNATEYTNEDKNSNRYYSFKGIKMKSNATYNVSLDYYVETPFTDYAAAFGYNAKNLGIGSSEQVWVNGSFINNQTARGWFKVEFTVTTGDVVPNASYFNLAVYDVNNSAEPRVMHFDNLTVKEVHKIQTSINDSTLGTATRTFTVEGGKNAKVVANAFAGAKFEGWYEYGDLVSTDKIYRITNVDDNHRLEAKFSGEAKPATTVVQSFEDYDLGDVDFEWYEIVNDSKNVLDGKQSLHIKPDKIEESIEASIFFPLVSSVEHQLKNDYSYDVYAWIKPAKAAENVTYFAVINSETRDMSDMLYSGQFSGEGGVSLNIKPQTATALEEKNGWLKYRIGTINKRMSTLGGFAFQVCKFHANRGEGASIDDLYIDRIEVVERTPDFANLKYTEKFFNEITNSNFEEAITNENWGPLTDGLTVEKVTNKEFDWQGNYQLSFNAAKSNGKEYVRVIPISKIGKNYTFAAWAKLSSGSDITVGLYKNGNYETFENIVNGEKGTLPLKADGKWNRVSFTFNNGNYKDAYLVIKGTKGTLQLDMVELFIAERGYLEDPNVAGSKGTFEMVDPIAFPDKVITVTTQIDEEETEEEPEENKKPGKTKKKYKVVKKRKTDGNSVWLWVGIGAGGLVLAAAVIFFVLFRKNKKAKKEAK